VMWEILGTVNGAHVLILAVAVLAYRLRKA
jgi:hypothetical protein